MYKDIQIQINMNKYVLIRIEICGTPPPQWIPRFWALKCLLDFTNISQPIIDGSIEGDFIIIRRRI